ncbi:hypothetical protein KUF71_024669 [Frankliniella fusca]|uniref:Uncharacterized protein n=1 Tax=Frankliniella fusca TaxID=407009 RepID=A0AAE1LDA1_9NEOP|nr:hypothetical protein KUF71_024669 [Frankliniella fusca]
MTDLDELSAPPCSASATYRSPPPPRGAGCVGPPPAAPPPPPPPAASTTPAPGAAAPPPPPPAARQPVYHRLNPDVFFMAADRSAGDALSWQPRDYHHTQV